MISTIKTQLYDILANELKYNVMDNPYGEETKSFPYVLLTLQDTHRDMKKGAYFFEIKFKIDIFSEYNGEKEILDMEQAIYEKSHKLLDNDFVTYYRESAFRIMDDKSTGTLKKHGVITYTIYSTGGLEFNDNDETNA